MNFNFTAIACLAAFSSAAFGNIVFFGSTPKGGQKIEVSEEDVFEQPAQDDYQITRLFDSELDFLDIGELTAVFLGGDEKDTVFFVNVDEEGRAISEFKVYGKNYLKIKLKESNPDRGFVDESSKEAKRAKVASSFIRKMTNIGVDQTLPAKQVQEYCESRLVKCRSYNAEVDSFIKRLEDGQIILLNLKAMDIPEKLHDLQSFTEILSNKEAGLIIRNKLISEITKNAYYFER